MATYAVPAADETACWEQRLHSSVGRPRSDEHSRIPSLDTVTCGGEMYKLARVAAACGVILVASCAVPPAVSSASGGQGVAAITTDGQTSTIDGETSDSSTATGSIAPVDPALILHSSVVNPTVGARLDPAPEGSSAVSVDVARAELERRFGPLTSAFEPSLALYTNTTYGEIQTDDSVKPYYTKVLVWAFIATDVPADPTANHGAALGADGKAHPASIAPNARCNAVWTVDATTGKYMNGYSTCG